jgi:hypothetical protein
MQVTRILALALTFSAAAVLAGGTLATPAGQHEPISTSVATLFVTGDLDGGSPLWFTDRVSKGFSNQATVVIHGQGHTEWNDCIAELYGQLVRSGSVSGLNTKCPGVPLPPFKITSVAQDP